MKVAKVVVVVYVTVLMYIVCIAQMQYKRPKKTSIQSRRDNVIITCPLTCIWQDKGNTENTITQCETLYVGVAVDFKLW